MSEEPIITTEGPLLDPDETVQDVILQIENDIAEDMFGREDSKALKEYMMRATEANERVKRLLRECVDWFDALSGGEELPGRIAELCKKIKKELQDE